MTTKRISITSSSEAETARCAAAVAHCKAVRTIHLRGELGAGKTAWVRGYLRALGHTGVVKSPTYTLIEPYELDCRRVAHLDLYRLGDVDELEFIGLRDYFQDDWTVLIEWPERGEGMLSAPDLGVELLYGAAESQRVIQLSPGEKFHSMIEQAILK